MQLARIVETSGRVAGTTKRLEKIGLIAGLLEQLQPEEVEIAVSFLSGGTRQGRSPGLMRVEGIPHCRDVQASFRGRCSRLRTSGGSVV